MSIKIIKEPDVYVTKGELERYWEEYIRSMQYRVGHLSFEDWVRNKKASEKF